VWHRLQREQLCHDLGPAEQRRFIVYSLNFTLTWALRSYPLVSNVSTYWYGEFGDLCFNNWTQVEVEDDEKQDSSQSFSWQNVSIPGAGSVVRNVIAKFGPFESNQLALDLQFANVTTPLYSRWEISTTGTLIGTTVGFARIIVVVDDDCSRIQWIEG
jgi:hypothetical protein